MSQTLALKREFTRFIHDGELSVMIVERLVDDTTCVAESELWDYKSQPPLDAQSWAKFVKHCMAFHNAYGGYIIFGINELGATGRYEFFSFEIPKNFNEDLRDQIKKYSSIAFQPNARFFTYLNHTVGVVYIPKRKEQRPVETRRAGPEGNKNKKPLFPEGKWPIRIADESIIAAGPDEIEILFSSRELPEIGAISEEKPLEFINRPDRSIICPRFVGREDLIEILWYWAADEFQRTKVLAGEGGKGKTSIAFEFAQQFRKVPLPGFEQIIWLSAKQRQFKGVSNEWIEMPDWHFSDFESLLLALAERMPIEEKEDQTTQELMRELARAFQHYPSLVVIDDVDSLDPQEQKRALEVAFQIAEKSKFLFTTRHNSTYSSAIATEVPGFSLDEFREFAENTRERLQIPLKPSEIKGLHKETHGSPLLCESVLRWIKLGYSFSQAISKWKGKDGEQARAAVLAKELDSLSAESKRMLLALALMVESSLSELRQVVGLDSVAIERGIEELGSLFMLSAPRITETEKRFSVSGNVRMLALERKDLLVKDYKKLEGRVTALSESSVRRRSGKIGRALSQASAQLRAGDIEAAKETVRSELNRLPNHPDLLVMLGNCELARESSEGWVEARKVFEKAFDCGQRKEVLFEKWYSTEEKLSHGLGMINVCHQAIQAESCDRSAWEEKLGKAHLVQSDIMRRGGDRRSEAEQIREASNAFRRAIKSRSRSPGPRLIEKARIANDKLIESRQGLGDSNLKMSRLLLHLIRTGDRRTGLYARLVQTLTSGELLTNRREALDLSQLCDEAIGEIEDAEVNEHRGVVPDASAWKSKLKLFKKSVSDRAE